MATSNLFPLFEKGIDEQFLLELMTYDPMWKDLFHMHNTGFRYVDHQGWIGYPLPGQRDPGDPIANGTFGPNYNKHYVIRNFGLNVALGAAQ